VRSPSASLTSLSVRATVRATSWHARGAARHGAALAEIAEQFRGHGLLAGNPARREARPDQRDLWFCDVIEPDARGGGGLRAAFCAALHPAAP
jgi:hypothetical protein